MRNNYQVLTKDGSQKIPLVAKSILVGAVAGVVVVAYRIVLTKAELLALTYNDINLEEKTISINKSYQRLKGKDMITQPKTPKSIRVITMPDFLAEEFREYCSHLYGIMKKERLFRFTKSHMEHCMATGIERSGVKRIRLHDLRHSHASMLVDMGVAPLEIAERLGHEKVETTLNTYSHLYPSTQSKLAGLLDKKHEEEEE